MECYFGACPLPEENQLGKGAIVVFNIPKVGIRFKAPFDGVDGNHCDLASLLALLEFIDSNQKYFSNHTYQIFGNNLTLINQLNGREQCSEMLKPLLERAHEYRSKYHFSLDWVPANENPALESLLD
ncbi:MAG: hypothetical protein IPH75_00915 [bacterium]|nr:hypothetical protein [bacterium]